jgi:ComF family protein
LRKLIHFFKYGKVQTLAGPVAKLLRLALPLDERFDLIVPMPMHWRKRWRRGFNQAELLARELGRRTARPVANLARRVHQKTAQAGLTSALRCENVADAFRVRDRRKVEGKRVLMVDFMTTGATAAACAKVLNRAGAARVILLTVAQVDPRIGAAEHRISTESFPESSFSGSFEDAKSGSFA